MTETDLRSKVCAQALTWKGRKEADGSHREIIDLYNTIRPLPRGYRLQYSDAWCAGFVSAVAQACGLTDYLYPECGCDRMIELYKQHGRWMEDDGYLPEPGDPIFYDWQDSGQGDNRGSADHVGLVVDVQGDLITICEGNLSDAVGIRTLFRDNRYIRGYGLPDYASMANEEEDGEDTNVPATPEKPDVIIPDEEPEVPAWTIEVPMLEYGHVGGYVAAAQALLILRGCGCGPDGADGDFGANTRRAVLTFQRSRDLEQDGIIGPATWEALLRG